jgi:glycosyltransferase involved in cell wall biosynthesis
MTGGLKEQVTDGETFFGVGIEPCSRAVIGSLEVPFIFEDRISEKDFVEALEKVHNMTFTERYELGTKAVKYVEENYSFKQFKDSWYNLFKEIVEEHGSWPNRKYSRWELKKL